MSIVNQLMAAVLAVLIGLVSGTVYLMSDSSKQMLLNQLESHGQDTATHLGLYMAPFMAEKDSAAIETTVNAIFDSGFYQHIKVVDAGNQTLFDKKTTSQAGDKVPGWFIDLVEITPPEMTREVTSQWQKVGSIFVQSRAGYAYEQLWRGTKQTFIWFVVLSLLSMFFISLLMKYILRPLQGVEEQALALSQQRYIEQSSIPGTRELKQVVLAMNMMVQRVRTMFDEQAKSIEEIRRTAYLDELTGLANQRATLTRLNERIDYRKDFGQGSLIHLHICDLQALNRDLGMEKANNFIRAAAGQLEQLSQKCNDQVLGRITGSDLILLSDITDPDLLQRELSGIIGGLNDFYRQLDHQQHEQPICIGATAFNEGSASEQLLANARLAAERARNEQTALFCEDIGNSQAQESWHQHVSNKISNGDIFLQAQPVRSINEQTPVHNEVYARILNQENQPCMAGEFISVVKQLNLIKALDRSVLNTVIAKLSQGFDTPICVNLSNDALKDQEFCNWLISEAAKLSDPAQLIIEINETSVLNNLDSISQFRELLKQQGVTFGVDNFGIHPAGFSYLYSLQPDYVKVDGSLMRELDQNAEDRFFVRSLITAAHSLDIATYAEHIEREAQLTYLKQLEMDGAQGWVFGQPTTLK